MGILILIRKKRKNAYKFKGEEKFKGVFRSHRIFMNKNLSRSPIVTPAKAGAQRNTTGFPPARE
jgi:hypothetical protein